MPTGSDGDSARRSRRNSKLLPSKPFGGLSVKSQGKLSAKAKKVQVASQKGDGPTTHRTDIAEAWVPLQGAGSDARLLLRLQGAHLHAAVGSSWHWAVGITHQWEC